LNNNPPSIKEPVSLHIGLWSNGLPTKSSDVIEQKRLKDARGGHPVEEVGVPTWQIKLNEPIRPLASSAFGQIRLLRLRQDPAGGSPLLSALSRTHRPLD